MPTRYDRAARPTPTLNVNIAPRPEDCRCEAGHLYPKHLDSCPNAPVNVPCGVPAVLTCWVFMPERGLQTVTVEMESDDPSAQVQDVYLSRGDEPRHYQNGRAWGALDADEQKRADEAAGDLAQELHQRLTAPHNGASLCDCDRCQAYTLIRALFRVEVVARASWEATDPAVRGLLGTKSIPKDPEDILSETPSQMALDELIQVMVARSVEASRQRALEAGKRFQAQAAEVEARWEEPT